MDQGGRNSSPRDRFDRLAASTHARVTAALLKFLRLSDRLGIARPARHLLRGAGELLFGAAELVARRSERFEKILYRSGLFYLDRGQFDAAARYFEALYG